MYYPADPIKFPGQLGVRPLLVYDPYRFYRCVVAVAVAVAVPAAARPLDASAPPRPAPSRAAAATPSPSPPGANPTSPQRRLPAHAVSQLRFSRAW